MTVKTSISFPQVLLDKAHQRATELGFTSLSAYLQDLVRRDLEEGARLAEPGSAYKRPLDELIQALHAQTESVNKLLKREAKEQE